MVYKCANRRNMAGLVALIMNLYMYMQRWYVIIFLKIWPTSDPNISMTRSLYCHKTFSMCKLIPITQITSKISLNILPSFLHNKNGIRLGATIFKINCSWYTMTQNCNFCHDLKVKVRIAQSAFYTLLPGSSIEDHLGLSGKHSAM